MQFPKITIVTPSYNQGRYLEQTILSILDQQYPNLEYIIIDGGSTDNSTTIIRRYEKYLHYWVSEKDSGMYDAIEKGFKRSSGDIMGWLNSDDLYHKGSLRTVAEIFSTLNEVRWLQGATTYFDDLGRCVEVKKARRWTKYHFLNGDYQWIQQESTFWHRSLWEEAGAFLRTDLRYAGDFELWCRFFRISKLHTFHGLIGGFRIHSDSQLSSAKASDYLAEVRQVHQAFRQATPVPASLAKRQKAATWAASIPYLGKRLQTRMMHRLERDYYEVPPVVSFDFQKKVFLLR